ncbi:ABC transporter substrate-binding protein [Roseomonas hellenica]|uniref:ABC transporter substrate-binding protein n=1 Tax=Plastoroseomonas hellenica TaxID=2687306 RepID=A0ABS5F9X3_9PROT|nr:ABC transporter substrate-binding protein [Plastoroseomonas hellenica]MBR0669364.1 ABC transporter substrate-binding protein [Plastoroseomonas hellenica]
MKRRTLLGAAGAAALARPALTQPATARVLRFVPETNLIVLDPIVTTAAVTTMHGYAVFDTLYGVDEQLRPQPQMAEGARFSDDGKTCDILLREGLVFHDGERVLARDAVASLRRWSQRDSFGQALAAAVDAWEAPDDRTIRVRLKRPFPHLLRAIGKPHSSPAFIMPERMASTDAMRPITDMVGSGPLRFKADEYVSGSRIVYTRFEGYRPRDEAASWSAGGKRVHFDRVEWHVMPDHATAAAALRAGEVDWWETAQGDLVPALRRDRRLTVRPLNAFGLILGMRFNHATQPFSNPALRRAILAAVNQADYLQAVTGGDADSYRLCRAMFPCGLPGVNELGVDAMKQPPDLAQARAAVAAAGYRGEKVVLLHASDHPVIAPLGDITADLLRRLGMNVDQQTMDWGTVVQRRVSQEPVERGGWSIFHTTWPGSSVTNPAENLYIRGQGARGWFGWHDNPEAERLTAEWLATSDPGEAQRLLDAVQRSTLTSVPVVPLGQMLPNMAHRRELGGIVTASSPYFWSVRRQ